MEPLEGRLLVAAPSVADPDLAQTVILLIQHSEHQAVGVVLNRPAAVTVRELWKSQVKKPCDVEAMVHSGGPVPGPIMAVHTHQPLADLEIMSGVYYTVKAKNLQSLVRQPDVRLLIFDSHAGWGPGQLEAQLEHGSWQVATTTADEIFAAGPDMWGRLVEGA